MREFLIDTVVHLQPAPALEGLSSADAERRLDGAQHSIAEIVAHADFWQRWFTDRCNGVEAPMVAAAADGWPAVAAGSWPNIRQQFLDNLERAASLGTEDRLAQPLAPPIDFPPLAHYTMRDALTHMVSHNSHHLGQVIVLRQLMGLWPPPAGSWTW